MACDDDDNDVVPARMVYTEYCCIIIMYVYVFRVCHYDITTYAAAWWWGRGAVGAMMRAGRRLSGAGEGYCEQTRAPCVRLRW